MVKWATTLLGVVLIIVAGDQGSTLYAVLGGGILGYQMAKMTL